MKRWKTFVTISASCFFMINPLRVSQACWSGPEWYELNYITNNSVMNTQFLDTSYEPLFFSFELFYNNNWDLQADKKEANLSDWVTFFEGKASKKDLETMIYSYSDTVLWSIKEHLINNAPLPDTGMVTSVLPLLNNDRNKAPFMDYLLFAKRCEPHTRKYDWYEESFEPSEEKEVLYEAGVTAYRAANVDFIRMRYAYLLTRLAHYRGDYDKAVAYFDDFIEPLKDVSSLIYYWGLGQKAGALRGMGKNLEANLLYARVFDNCPSLRVAAYKSVLFGTDAEWASMTSIASSSEILTLLLMRAINPFANVTEELIQMYNIDPNSKHLEFLTIREIQKLEKKVFTERSFLKTMLENPKNDWMREEFSNQNQAFEERLSGLKAFVTERLPNFKNKPFWKMVEAYLFFLEGDSKKALQKFEDLKSKERLNKITSNQVEILKLLAEVTSYQYISGNEEYDLFTRLEEVEFPEKMQEQIKQVIYDHLAIVYRKQGNLGKAFLCQFDFRHLMYHPDEAVLRSIIDLLSVKMNDGEMILIDRLKPFINTSIDYYDDEGQKIEEKKRFGEWDFVHEVAGTLMLAEGRFGEAIEFFNQLSSNFTSNYWRFHLGSFDPFDYSQGYIPYQHFTQSEFEEKNWQTDTAHYHKLKLAYALYDLNNGIENAPNRGERYFKLGVAMYNISYYGRLWRAGDYWRGYGVYYPNASENGFAYADKNNLDLREATRYLQAAYETADSKETKAKAAAMLARCERSKYGHLEWEQQKGAKELRQFESWTETISKKFDKTDFYKFILESCGSVENYCIK